jgi:phage tail-like protein
MSTAYPLMNLNFIVEVGGETWGGFSEVTGLSVEIETEDYQEGGVNDFVHKLPKSVKYSNIVLKKGLVEMYKMWDWIEKMMDGVIQKKDCSILLLNDDGSTARTWAITQAYPVKWSGSDLKATGGEVFIESLELTHCGITKS